MEEKKNLPTLSEEDKAFFLRRHATKKVSTYGGWDSEFVRDSIAAGNEACSLGAHFRCQHIEDHNKVLLEIERKALAEMKERRV
jgi:hypothetical protein